MRSNVMNLSPRPKSSPTVESHPRVLVVDDDNGTRDVLAQMLKGQYQAVLHNDGSSAWEQLERDTSIAGLITDIDMPGLDGYELVAKVRAAADARLQKMPIIVITGAADQETRRRIFVSGATGLVTKPIDRGQLLGLALAYIHQVPEEFLKSASTVTDTQPKTEAPLAAEVSSSPQSGSIEFETTPAVVMAPAPTASTADAMDELSVSDLEAMVRQDVTAALPPTTVEIPAELIGIDAALQAIQDGHGDALTPYLAKLEQRLQPFLSRYRQRFGHDIRP